MPLLLSISFLLTSTFWSRLVRHNIIIMLLITNIFYYRTTGGSGTSEVCCEAAIKACRKLKASMHAFKTENPGLSWEDLVASLPPDVSLNADGWYSPSENPNKQEFQYYVWGACVSEVELDVLTGMVNVLSSEIM